jgi:hypothetical protein
MSDTQPTKAEQPTVSDLVYELEGDIRSVGNGSMLLRLAATGLRERTDEHVSGAMIELAIKSKLPLSGYMPPSTGFTRQSMDRREATLSDTLTQRDKRCADAVRDLEGDVEDLANLAAVARQLCCDLPNYGTDDHSNRDQNRAFAVVATVERMVETFRGQYYATCGYHQDHDAS